MINTEESFEHWLIRNYTEPVWREVGVAVSYLQQETRDASDILCSVMSKDLATLNWMGLPESVTIYFENDIRRQVTNIFAHARALVADGVPEKELILRAAAILFEEAKDLKKRNEELSNRVIELEERLEDNNINDG